MNNTFNTLFDMAKAHDYDRFLCALYGDKDLRPILITLIALNYELGKIRETVSEPMVGDIKLAWWREAIEGIFAGKVRNQTILQSLDSINSKHGLDEKLLLEMVEAREVDFEDSPMDNFEDLRSYALKTGGNLGKIAVTSLKGTELEQRAAYLIGGAWSLVGILRAVEFQAMTNHTLLPNDILKEQDVSLSQLAKGEGAEKLAIIYKKILDEAKNMIAEARKLCPKPTKKIFPVFLPAVIAGSYIKSLEIGQTSPENFGSRGALGLQLKLFWANLRGRF